MPDIHSRLYRELLQSLPASRLLRDPVSTLAFGGDAGFYRLTPKLVVKVFSESEAALVLAACHEEGVAVTIRAAGTSLSGQAQSDSVLMQIGRGFGTARVLDGGARIRMRPAVIGAAANRMLAPYGRKLGPDPASIDSAMIGGIAANNASGMCCGTAQNCYRTLVSMRIVFADGSLLDTGDAESRRAFSGTHGGMLDGLSRLAAEVREDAELSALIRRKYAMKNTTGYSLNALADFRDPIEILQHLLIGSEGTLGFISEITLDTVPDPRHKTAILACFGDTESLGRAVMALAATGESTGARTESGQLLSVAGTGVQAVEYMDAASLLSVAGHPEIAAAGALPSGCAALLIDVRAEGPEALERNCRRVLDLLVRFPMAGSPVVSMRESQYQSLWGIRKGLFPAIGAMRPPGTAVIIEDVAFPVTRLTEALADLRALLDGNGYAKAIIYGHALFGNLHFVFWQDFSNPAEVDRYAAFMERLTDLVVYKYGGSLKAEHGTGRNMAPFVEKEWGARAYAIMHSVKALFDPRGILNPDVILSADKRIHVKNLKPLPLADPLVDKCIECGFCESVCPSRNATLTPRQRIVTWREIERLRGLQARGPYKRPVNRRLKALELGFAYQGEKTCATDGLCAMNCPVGIDTGSLIKSIRAAAKPWWQRALADAIAGHFALFLSGTRLALGVLHAARKVFGAEWVSMALRTASRIAARVSPGLIPAGLEFLPRPGRAITTSAPARSAPASFSLPSSEPPPSVFSILPDSSRPSRAERVLYLPSCINRAFGPHLPQDPSLPEITISLLRRAGYEVILPEGIDGLCCGLAFASKGFPAAGDAKLREVRAALSARAETCIAVVCDATPCTQRLAATCAGPIPIQDAAVFLQRHALPRLNVTRRKTAVAFHPVCSAVKMGTAASLEALAAACAETVAIPEGVPCCGVAGDRIFLHPELSQSACAGLCKGLPEGCREGYSTSRTCEIGLARSGGIPYRSLLYLLHEATAPETGTLPPAAAPVARRGAEALSPREGQRIHRSHPEIKESL